MGEVVVSVSGCDGTLKPKFSMGKIGRHEARLGEAHGPLAGVWLVSVWLASVPYGPVALKPCSLWP